MRMPTKQVDLATPVQTVWEKIILGVNKTRCKKAMLSWANWKA